MLLSHLQMKESTEREFTFAETDTWHGKQMKMLRVLLGAASFIYRVPERNTEVDIETEFIHTL